MADFFIFHIPMDGTIAFQFYMFVCGVLYLSKMITRGDVNIAIEGRQILSFTRARNLLRNTPTVTLDISFKDHLLVHVP